MSIESLLEKLATEGGCIVSSDQCSEMEIADARVRGDLYVRDDGCGFVRRLPGAGLKPKPAHPPRFFYTPSAGRLYCNQQIDGNTNSTQKALKDGTVMYQIGSNLTRPMAERIAAMFGGKVEE